MFRYFLALIAFVAASVGFSERPAEAQSRQYRDTGTVFYSTDENGRRRTRIIVQPRSFLDAGTEVLPGERKFQDYAFPPNYSASSNALGPGLDFDQRQPLNNWFDVPHRY